MTTNEHSETTADAIARIRAALTSDEATKRALTAYMAEINRWTIKAVPRVIVEIGAELSDWCVYRDNDSRYRLISRHLTKDSATRSLIIKSTEAAMRAALHAVAPLAVVTTPQNPEDAL